MERTAADKITLRDVEQVLPLKSWWAMVAILPLVRPLTLAVVNYTSLTPNSITMASIFFRLITAGSFATATKEGYIIGAFAYYFAYLLDCMDGAVARLRKMSSDFGRFLDHIGDLAGDFLILLSLAWSQGMLVTPMVVGMLYMHLAECYINYLAGSITRDRTQVQSSFAPLNLFNTYRDWWFNRNIKSFFSFPDYTALVFVIFPLCNHPIEGIKTGFIVLLTVCLYTILSTFASIHTGRRQFP
jgi:phosphatidylglycerophosphate synthase